MFTGIVEEVGSVSRVQRSGSGYELTIRAQTVLSGTKLGDSIAVNGVCLTVTGLTAVNFTVGLSPETRARTSLEHLREGKRVNLERALTPSSRMGGHFVQGHVDGVGTITAFRPDADALWVTVNAPPEVMRYVVPKGFIALDGVSLTVVDVTSSSFTVTLVAYTQQQITLPQQKAGDQINIEVDILGKYIEKQMDIRFGKVASPDISLGFLAEHGYS
jgi:riboflavin synthase